MHLDSDFYNTLDFNTNIMTKVHKHEKFGEKFQLLKFKIDSHNQTPSALYGLMNTETSILLNSGLPKADNSKVKRIRYISKVIGHENPLDFFFKLREAIELSSNLT
ncbi:MAG: hypothetical protein NE330_08565 [Lentisphaeraceae bacterium]|nr:hypothetical protein [Lentisphaeraceae bacterium]